MRTVIPTLLAPTILLTLVACGPDIDFGGSSSGSVAQDRTEILEGEWTLSVTDELGQYDNLIEFSANGQILHWYDQYDNDFFADLDGGYSNISVSATNQVSFFFQYEYMHESILYSVEVSLTGLLYGGDNLLDLSGSTSLFENGSITETDPLSVYANRGRDDGGNDHNDGALTSILEGPWFFTINDLTGTEIHSIEFDEFGDVQHWINPYGTDLALIDVASSMFASLSSSYTVDLGASYTIAYDDSAFDVHIDFSGDMLPSEDEMTLDGLVKIYSDGYLVSLLHSSAVAHRSSFVDHSSSGNENFSHLEGEWGVMNNDMLGNRLGHAICDQDGNVTHWYLNGGVDILSSYQSSSAAINISSDNRAYALSFYEGTDVLGIPFTVHMESSGPFNDVNSDFMQMVGEVTAVGSFGTHVYPTFFSAYRNNPTATISNGNTWPIEAMLSQRAELGYGPLFSPWSFD